MVGHRLPTIAMENLRVGMRSMSANTEHSAESVAHHNQRDLFPPFNIYFTASPNQTGEIHGAELINLVFVNARIAIRR